MWGAFARTLMNVRQGLVNMALWVRQCKVRQTSPSFAGVLRKGPPFRGSRSSIEIELQIASCEMGGREVTGTQDSIPVFHATFFGAGKRGHYERGLFIGGISRISKI